MGHPGDSAQAPACSRKPSPQLREIECPKCGEDLELWSDEEETACASCGTVVRNPLPPA